MSIATHHELISPRIEARLRRGELTDEQVDGFRSFLERVERDLLAPSDHHRQCLHPLVQATAAQPMPS